MSSSHPTKYQHYTYTTYFLRLDRCFRFFSLFSTFLFLALANSAFASEVVNLPESTFPNRSVRIVVGFAPGGPTDRVTRELAAKLQEAWPHPVIVDNKPGAGGRIAFEIVSKAAPDGHTLVVSGVQAATLMVAYKNPGFDTLRDFEPLSQLTSSLLVLAVNPATGVRSVTELIERAKVSGKSLTFSTSGVASSPHFAAELLSQVADISVTHVPYSGAAGAQNALVSGHVDFAFVSPLSSLALLRDGKLRALAVTGTSRARVLPDVPTMIELGHADFEVNSWQAILAPAGTPSATLAKLHRGIATAFSHEDVRARLRSVEADPVATSPQQFRAYLSREIEKWGRVARRAKILVE